MQNILAGFFGRVNRVSSAGATSEISVVNDPLEERSRFKARPASLLGATFQERLTPSCSGFLGPYVWLLPKVPKACHLAEKVQSSLVATKSFYPNSLRFVYRAVFFLTGLYEAHCHPATHATKREPARTPGDDGNAGSVLCKVLWPDKIPRRAEAGTPIERSFRVPLSVAQKRSPRTIEVSHFRAAFLRSSVASHA